MCARELPAACQGAEGDGGGARSPLKVSPLQSLREAFLEVPDPRSATSRRHPLSALLGLIALGLLMGARDVLDIWRKVACLSQRQREALGLCVRDKQSGRLTMPGYDALNDLLGAIDPAAYARVLTAFLQAHAGLLPRSLALDGKSVGNGRCGMILTLCRHEDGRPVAMTVARGKKEDCEVSEGRALPADPQVELVNALVTAAPPLHASTPCGIIRAAPARSRRAHPLACGFGQPSPLPRPGPVPRVLTMATEFDPSEFVDDDFQTGRKTGGTGKSASGTTLVLTGSTVAPDPDQAPTREELDTRVTDMQTKLAELKRAQQELERERADIEETRRRQAEFSRGRQEMEQHITRGLGLLEESEFTARRDAEQMSKAIGDLRDALLKVQTVHEETWTKDNLNTELTRALTAVENARMEWNSARIKFPLLSGESATPTAQAPGAPAQSLDNILKQKSYAELCKLGLALTWPIALVALAIFLVLLLRR